MQNFYFSPLTSLIFILSTFFIIIVLSIYYTFNKSILSIYNFNAKGNLINIKNLLTNNNEYNIWWPKFKKFFIYKTYVSHIYDDTFTNAKIIITIHSNAAQEEWEVILKQIKTGVTNVTVHQDLKLLSKLARILKSSIFYKKDIISFKKSLQKQLLSS